jgi:hypothetical protein
VISENPSIRSGVALPKPFAPCGPSHAPCLRHALSAYTHALYEPASRFWHMQARRVRVLRRSRRRTHRVRRVVDERADGVITRPGP